jgi:hypothetical protein
MLGAAAMCLADQSAAVRTWAAMSLASRADPAAIPYLESAIVREQDSTVRAQMQSSLEQLKKKTHR